MADIAEAEVLAVAEVMAEAMEALVPPVVAEVLADKEMFLRGCLKTGNLFFCVVGGFSM